MQVGGKPVSRVKSLEKLEKGGRAERIRPDLPITITYPSIIEVRGDWERAGTHLFGEERLPPQQPLFIPETRDPDWPVMTQKDVHFFLPFL